jgi:hypothetical protein
MKKSLQRGHDLSSGKWSRATTLDIEIMSNHCAKLVLLAAQRDWRGTGWFWRWEILGSKRSWTGQAFL